jgi:hypothetical protein
MELVTPKFFTPSSNAPLMPTNIVGVGVPPVESTPTVQHGKGSICMHEASQFSSRKILQEPVTLIE